jgi:hypothetical protein
MNPLDYANNVVSCRQGFDEMVTCCGNEIAGNPKKWCMHNLYMSVYRDENFYRVGYVGRDCFYSSTYFTLTTFQKAYLIWSGEIVQATVNEREKYRKEYKKFWWCRCNHWRPFWGDLTKQHASLMNEMRNYWMKHWFEREKPQIVKKLHEYTRLNSDNIDMIVDYLPFPYQAKRI